MNTTIIKTFPFLKHYKRKADDHRQVIIRTKIFIRESRKQKLIKSFDIPLYDENNEFVRATESEFRNYKIHDKLKYRIPEIEKKIQIAVQRLIREQQILSTKIITKYTYSPPTNDETGDILIFNDDIEELFGYPIPAKLYEAIESEPFIDAETGDSVPYEELKDCARWMEGDYYSKKRAKEVDAMDYKERYKLGLYDKNNIFDCFGFCWSLHPKNNEPLIPDSYKSLLLRLHDYRYNSNPLVHVNHFNDEWIDNFIKFMANEGYAVIHPKDWNPFKIKKYRLALMRAKRKGYKYGGFSKQVKNLKRYIYLMQKYKIIDYHRNVKFINPKDYVGRKVNTTGFTRREHSLTIVEFNKLCNTDFSDKKLNTARDMFIIATLGGGFRGEEFYNDELSVSKIDGRYVLHLYRSKTQTPEINPVFGELEKVIQRNNDNLPEFLPETELRKSLKEIAKILNFDRVISSPNTYLDSEGGQIQYILNEIFSIYFARKTFVGFLNSSGMVDDDIIEFTSHSKIDTLKHYKGKLSIQNKFKLLERCGVV